MQQQQQQQEEEEEEGGRDGFHDCNRWRALVEIDMATRGTVAFKLLRSRAAAAWGGGSRFDLYSSATVVEYSSSAFG